METIHPKVQAMRDKQNATKDLVPLDQIERLRVLWTKGRNMFQSFFTETETIRRQIGNDELFASWCFFQLHIGVSAITDIAAVVLKEDDAARIRNEFATAKQAEKDRHAEEVHARKLEKIKKENELAAERVKNAERKAEEAKLKAKRLKEEKAAVNKARRIARAEREGDSRERVAKEILADPTASRETIMQKADASAIIVMEVRGRLEAEGKVVPKAAIASDKTLYDQYVIEGRAVIGHQWTLGDLARKVCELPSYGAKKLETYAHDIGAEYSSLQVYRATAKAWPENLRRLSFSLASALAAHPDRFALIAKNPLMTVEEAREIMRVYKTETNIVQLRTPENG